MRAATRDGEDIVEFFVDTLNDKRASRKDRIEAGKWLADRGFGKAVETSISLTGQAGELQGGLADLADAELEALARSLAPSGVSPGVSLLRLDVAKPSESLEKTPTLPLSTD